MNKLIIGLVGLVLAMSSMANAQCVKDAAGLPVDAISKSAAMDVLNQIGGFPGLTGKWVTEGGSFVFAIKAGKVDVTYSIGKTSKSTTVAEVCKLTASSMKVIATSGGKSYTVFMKLTGNPNKIQLGFDPDDTTDFVKQ